MGFSNKTKITQFATREYPLDIDLGGGKTPTLIVRHAGESNASFWSAALKQSNVTTRRGNKVTPATITEGRQADAKLFAKHIVVNWKNVYEDDDKGGGKFVEFDTLKCEQLLMMLVAEEPAESHELRVRAFSDLKSFVGNFDNFYETQLDGAELGKP